MIVVTDQVWTGATKLASFKKAKSTLCVGICIAAINGCNNNEEIILPANRLQFESEYIALEESTLTCVESETSAINGFMVFVDLSPEAAAWFQSITQSNVGKTFDIVLDDVLLRSPKIMEPIHGNSLMLRPYSPKDRTLIDNWLVSVSQLPGCSTL